MFNTDQPIDTGKDDILGRLPFAKAVAKAILSYKESDSLSIGLFGEWGSGKTSLINMALEEIKSIQKEKESIENEHLVIKFNPWNFSDSNQLVKQFFHELSLNLWNEKNRDEEIDSVLEEIALLVDIMAVCCGAPPVFGAIKKIFGFKNKSLSDVKREIGELLTKANVKLIIVIDDIDRLNNVEIRQIFQLVKSNADFKNTIYMLSFDKKVVINALKKVQEGCGNDYLKKVIQVQFEMPQVSEDSIKDFLSENLYELVKDLPKERRDLSSGYWFNSDPLNKLTELFANIRDVKRYINTLKFSFGCIKDEVHPMDFMLITAIQIFIPNLYEDIKNNKNFFLGIDDSFNGTTIKTTDGLASCQKNKDKKLETVVDKMDENQRAISKTLLEQIFPEMRPRNGVIDGDDHIRKCRICSFDSFDAYFKLSIPKDAISSEEVKRILSTANDIKSFSNELSKLTKDNKINYFLKRMLSYTQQIHEENIVPIIQYLMNEGDFLGIGENESYPSYYITTLFYQLIHRYDDEKKRFTILEDAINNTEDSLYPIVLEVEAQCDEYGEGESKTQRDKRTVNRQDLDKLINLTLSKIEEWGKSGKLSKHRYFSRIFFFWKHWDKKGVCDYSEKLINDNEGLADFIKAFFSDFYESEEQISGYHSHNVAIKRHRLSETIKEYVNLDEFKKRVREFQSTRGYGDLDDNSRRAMKRLLGEVTHETHETHEEAVD